METKKCPQCGTGFEGRANKLYCSTNCKMAAFYSTNARKSSTVNELPTPVSTISLTDYQSKAPTDMVTIPVLFTTAEKELLEQQSRQCETVLPKLIRVRSLMDETDIQLMQETIIQQKQQIEELRIKLGFFQGKDNDPIKNKQANEKSGNLVLIKMNQQQYEFIQRKYLESSDFEGSCGTMLPNKTISFNQKEVLLAWEQKEPNHIFTHISDEMLSYLISQIEERLIEHCGYNEEAFWDDSIIDEFFRLET